jgi:hypothetical protein
MFQLSEKSRFGDLGVQLSRFRKPGDFRELVTMEESEVQIHLVEVEE